MKITIPIPYKTYITKIKMDRKIQAAILGIFIIIIFLTVYALQQLQDVRSRAETVSTNGLTVTNENGDLLPYEGNDTYKTNSLDVNLKISDLEKLTQ